MSGWKLYERSSSDTEQRFKARRVDGDQAITLYNGDVVKARKGDYIVALDPPEGTDQNPGKTFMWIVPGSFFPKLYAEVGGGEVEPPPVNVPAPEAEPDPDPDDDTEPQPADDPEPLVN